MMRNRIWMTVLIAVFFSVCSPEYVRAQDREASEYEIKTAFMLNFLKFVEWPQRSLSPSSPFITLCFAGENPFRKHTEMIEGKSVNNRSVVVKRVSFDAAQSCNALFISASEQERITEKMQKLRDLPVLTIGDTAGYAGKGVIINMYMEQENVRFEINTDAAAQAGLQISSRLLKLARIVRASR